jgi:hypothetical protein
MSRNMDRNEVQVQIACILVALPLPPLPILVCRGEDAVDGVCSSHDLHACMIATDMQPSRKRKMGLAWVLGRLALAQCHQRLALPP